MIILGITGPIGHGKTTFADMINEIEPSTVHMESGLIIAEVADALHAYIPTPIQADDIDWINEWLRSLPAILKNIVHIDCDEKDVQFSSEQVQSNSVEYQKLVEHVESLYRDPDLAKQKITIENKKQYRSILQWLGGYLVNHVDSGIWYNEVARRAKLAEIDGIKLCLVGGLRFPADAEIMKAAGAKIAKIYRPEKVEADSTDPTERERNAIRSDTIVINNGNLENLRDLAKRFFADLETNKLKPTYVAVQD